MNLFNGISHIGIPTRNLYKTTELYEKLGFKLINQEDNLGSKVYFFQINDLMLEVYEAKATPEIGAINHLAVETDHVEEAFNYIEKLGFEMIDKQVKHLPFWDHGISYFNFYGPNHEIIEVCQKNLE
ncbi:MAG TPA: VOC family protein [Candidatus Ligilactobacillus excrementavium]|nr:VOC family protein [Candidatus Ligilactobacillus excrementavium]